MFNLFKRKPKEIKIYGQKIKISSNSVPSTKGVSGKELIKGLRKAIKSGVFDDLAPCQFTEAFGKRFGRRKPLNEI